MNAFRNREIVFAGIIASTSHKVHANGKQYGTFILEDYSDSIQLALFSEDYLRWKHLVEEGFFLMIKARVQQRYNAPEQLEIKISHLSLLSETINTFAKSITLMISLSNVTEELISDIFDVVEANKGKSILNIDIFESDPAANIQMLSKKYKVNISKLVTKLGDLENVEYKIN